MHLPRLRFPLWTIEVGVALVALVVAALAWMIRPEADRLALAPQPASANVDHEIFDIVLDDLLDNNDFNPSGNGGRATHPEVVLGNTTLAIPRRANLANQNLNSWMRENKASPELLDDVIARGPKGTRYSLNGYRPSSANILVRDTAGIDMNFGFSSKFPKAAGYVQALLPGYSHDGQDALMPFTFGPCGDHSTFGYYLLKRVRGRWQITGRLLYFMV